MLCIVARVHRALLEVLFIFAIHQSVKYSQYHCQRKLHGLLYRRLSVDGGGKKDLELVPRSVLKCDNDADSGLKEGDEKGMRWKEVACVFWLSFVMREERVHPRCH